MKYCVSCLIPETRPNVDFDQNGECSACRNFRTRPAINWAERERNLSRVFENAKKRSTGYDCLIPVSGGKDSTWQVVKCLEYGLNPLCVTWKTPARTEIGRRNLENMIAVGVDHIDFQVNPKVEKKFLLAAYEKYGATGVPMHMALFNIPLSLAVKFRIPLVIWGENSAFEYGNSHEQETGFRLDSSWLKRYGVTHGTTAIDWVGDTLARKEMTPYFGPTDQELEAAGVSAIFLGYYLPWDPQETYRVAKEHGFQADASGPKTGFYDYADIDDDFISIHHYLKWHKFGFTRAFDNLSIEIRQGRLSRGEALAILKKMGDQTPREDIKKFCKFVGISEERFYSIAEKFRNPNVWSKENGVWKIKDFILPDWKWD